MHHIVWWTNIRCKFSFFLFNWIVTKYVSLDQTATQTNHFELVIGLTGRFQNSYGLFVFATADFLHSVYQNRLSSLWCLFRNFEKKHVCSYN